MKQKTFKQLYLPKMDMKDVVVELLNIVDSIFPNESRQHISIQDMLIEMKKWGKSKIEIENEDH